ncbi:hypothetical protein MKEN_00797800 [Mycena kentingensis (nom. inval.)]|nr:hypothetical protein MKEN_00797800 [Mycena kentingensis (nom. inval.)]
MADFFSSVVGGALNPPATEDTKGFADALAARFNSSTESVLTARLFQVQPPPPSFTPPQPTTPSLFTALSPKSLPPWLDDPGTLVVDIRPHAAYATARLTRAVSLSVPSTLLKRPMFSLQRISAMLPSASARTRFSAWRTATRIVVYDADSTTLGDTSNINGLLRKFKAEAPDSEIALAWVVGGFQAMWISRRDLVDTVAPANETETEDDDGDDSDMVHPRQRVLRAHNLPRAAFSMSSTTQAPKPMLGAFLHNHNATPPTGPDASSETSAFNPFYDSVRQNTELSQGITERIPLRLPRRVRRRITELPFDWLRQIAFKAAPATPPMVIDPNAIRGRKDMSSGDESSDSEVLRWHQFSPAPSPGAIISPSLAVASDKASSDPSARNAATIDEGTEALAMQFYRIELAEQRRLMNVLEHHTRESGDAAPSSRAPTLKDGDRSPDQGVHPFSITAGVEKGSKNRYRNIWPFEHARVRLHKERGHQHEESVSLPQEHSLPIADSDMTMSGFDREPLLAEPIKPRIPSPEYDDYVNASFVQPLGTRRRYIATQGPLDSTFDDFWTLVWQQNTHVIVMLTREVEGATIKCGNYWHSGQYGPLRVELLGCTAEGCTGICSQCAGVSSDAVGGGSAGFFSDVRTPQPRSQIIRRTIRLTHDGHPSVPPRRVVQIQYLGWADMNVPSDCRDVLNVVWEVAKAVDEVEQAPPTNSNTFGITDSDLDDKSGVLSRSLRAGNAAAPVLLHCSAGVGRTGGFIVIDAILDAIRMETREMYASGRGSDAFMTIAVDPPGSGSGSASTHGSEGVKPPGSISASASGSGSGGLGGIAARLRGADIQSAPTSEDDDSMDVDRKDGSGQVSGFTPSAKGQFLRPPMQMDQTGLDIGMHDMKETQRWAQRVADTDLVSAFAPALFPQSAASSSSSLPLSTSFPPTPSLGAPFQLQLPNRRPAQPALSSTRPVPEKPRAESFPRETAASSSSRSLSARRGYFDQRLRTISEPTGPAATPGPAPFPRVLPPAERSASNTPLVAGHLPPSRSLSPFGQTPSMHRSIRSMDSADATPAAGGGPDGTRPADYKQPRPLHSQNGTAPVRLSALENPISEVLQDMREQRMSLCQSLRQYVFVHAAIIEGALMVADEERTRAGVALRAARALSPRGSRPRLIFSGDATQFSPATGKRLASPTELTKEDKKGDIALSKRPSIKRKQGSCDEYTPNAIHTYPPP